MWYLNIIQFRITPIPLSPDAQDVADGGCGATDVLVLFRHARTLDIRSPHVAPGVRGAASRRRGLRGYPLSRKTPLLRRNTAASWPDLPFSSALCDRRRRLAQKAVVRRSKSAIFTTVSMPFEECQLTLLHVDRDIYYSSGTPGLSELSDVASSASTLSTSASWTLIASAALCFVSATADIGSM